jgi:hypothetical protein
VSSEAVEALLDRMRAAVNGTPGGQTIFAGRIT